MSETKTPEVPDISVSWFRADNAWMLSVSVLDRSTEDLIVNVRKYGATVAVIDR